MPSYWTLIARCRLPRLREVLINGCFTGEIPSSPMPRFSFHFVCYGNICRSPLSEFVAQSLCATEFPEFAGSTFTSSGVGVGNARRGENAHEGCFDAIASLSAPEHLDLAGQAQEHRSRPFRPEKHHPRAKLPPVVFCCDLETFRVVKKSLPSDTPCSFAEIHDYYYDNDWGRALGEILAALRELFSDLDASV